MRRAGDPRLLRTEATDPKKTHGRAAVPQTQDATSAPPAAPSTLDASPTPTGPLSAEEGIAMENTEFLYGQDADPDPGRAPITNTQTSCRQLKT